VPKAPPHQRRVGLGTWSAISRRTKATNLMAEHKFKIGQLVHYYPKKVGRVPIDLGSGLYQIITRLRLTDDGERQYKIRNTLEQHDRVATESELTPI
jgi:hypothetical protein